MWYRIFGLTFIFIISGCGLNVLLAISPIREKFQDYNFQRCVSSQLSQQRRVKRNVETGVLDPNTLMVFYLSLAPFVTHVTQPGGDSEYAYARVKSDNNKLKIPLFTRITLRPNFSVFSRGTWTQDVKNCFYLLFFSSH